MYQVLRYTGIVWLSEEFPTLNEAMDVAADWRCRGYITRIKRKEVKACLN